jgi:transcriptional regulator with XRE-family HTH domain
MIIGDRLRALREEKKLSQGDIEKRTACFAATSPALKTATPFRPSKRWRRWLAHSRSLSINSFTTAKSPRAPESAKAEVI